MERESVKNMALAFIVAEKRVGNHSRNRKKQWPCESVKWCFIISDTLHSTSVESRKEDQRGGWRGKDVKTTAVGEIVELTSLPSIWTKGYLFPFQSPWWHSFCECSKPRLQLYGIGSQQH